MSIVTSRVKLMSSGGIVALNRKDGTENVKQDWQFREMVSRRFRTFGAAVSTFSRLSNLYSLLLTGA